MANSFTSESDPLGQTTERLWFQNPIQALSPEIVRPFSWSQVPSRLALYEEEDTLPQQTLAASGGTQDFSSSYNVSTNISNEYNFDVQQNSTAFVFNYNNTNNTTQVSYTEGDIINNNEGETVINNTYYVTTSGFTGTIISYSNSVWNEPNMVLDNDVTTAVYSNGLLVSVTTTVHSVTLDALYELWQWYENGLTGNQTFGSGVSISPNNDMLQQEYENWTFVNGLVTAITLQNPVGNISPLTDCT